MLWKYECAWYERPFYESIHKYDFMDPNPHEILTAPYRSLWAETTGRRKEDSARGPADCPLDQGLWGRARRCVELAGACERGASTRAVERPHTTPSQPPAARCWEHAPAVVGRVFQQQDCCARWIILARACVCGPSFACAAGGNSHHA